MIQIDKVIRDLNVDIKTVENNYDYYDSSESTRRMKELEKRMTERLIKSVKGIGKELERIEREANRPIIHGGQPQ
jgi:hypothetical protein